MGCLGLETFFSCLNCKTPVGVGVNEARGRRGGAAGKPVDEAVGDGGGMGKRKGKKVRSRR